MIKAIKIGKVIENKNPKNKFVLHLKTEHGDADQYATEVFMWNYETAIKYWNLLSIYFNCGFNYVYVSDKDVKKMIEKEGIKQGIENSAVAYEELVGADMIFNGVMARPYEMWLTYFDKCGAEHNIDEPIQLG